MILHQTAVYKSPLALGTKDKPIYIDCDPNHATETPQLAVRTSTFTLPQRPCPPPVFNSTLKLNPRSRSRAKGKASSFATSPMCAESLVAEPMIANSQAIVQSLKRKHIDVEDDADLEMSKKLKKSEKKRRKRERRAARIAQLGDQMDSRHDPDVHSNLNKAPDHSDWSLAPPQWKAPIDTFWTNGSSSSNLTKPFTAMSSYETHSQQIEEFEMIVSQESESVSERTLNHIPPPSYSELAVSTTPTSGRRSASLKMSPLVEQVSNPIVEMTPPTSTLTGSSLLNRRIQERMALLVEHRRLGNGADGFPPAPPPARPPALPIAATSTHITKNAIAVKQNLLDLTISENKAALTQLGIPLIKEEKSNIMRAIMERNKLIMQLTSEIKAHFDSLGLMVAPARPNSPLDNVVAKFKWPETQFPLYLIITDDDEECGPATDDSPTQ